MAEAIGLMNCPICNSEVSVKRNSNKKPTFYCRVCRVQIVSSGGQSQAAIMSQVRPIETAATPLLDNVEKKEVLANGGHELVQGGEEKPDGGGEVEPKRGGFLGWLVNGE